MSQAPFPQLVNFTAAARKTMLIPSGLFSPTQSISWIYSTIGGTLVPTALTGTIDGANRVFTSPISIPNNIAVFLNGLYQDPTSSYVLSGTTITFAVAPEAGSTLQAIVS